MCNNNNGSFSCSCNTGFTLAADGKSCQGIHNGVVITCVTTTTDHLVVHATLDLHWRPMGNHVKVYIMLL